MVELCLISPACSYLVPACCTLLSGINDGCNNVDSQPQLVDPRFKYFGLDLNYIIIDLNSELSCLTLFTASWRLEIRVIHKYHVSYRIKLKRR